MSDGAFERREWLTVFRQLRAEANLDAPGLERLAVAAYLSGNDDESVRGWDLAHHAYLDAADVDAAVRCAVWLGITAMLRGNASLGGGWLGRAERIVADTEEDVPHGAYLLIPAGLAALASGREAEAFERFAEAAEAGRRAADPDLIALGILGQGQASIVLGDSGRGRRLLDEAMVGVTSGEVSVVTAGIVYCAVIDACVAIFDVRRAAEWTDALSRWCDEQPDLVPYRGQCLIHRSQVMQLRGRWGDAAAEVGRATVRLADPPHAALGLACYQRGELHRLRGEFDAAEEAYRDAGLQGFDPVPGYALLKLARGEGEAAATNIRRALAEVDDRLVRPRVVGAAVEILLRAGDPEGAEAATCELEAFAASLDAPVLSAAAHHSRGSLLLTSGEAEAALSLLRRAMATWRELAMPYELARTRVLIGSACRSIGDDHAGTLEFDAARETFVSLGAIVDVEHLDALVGSEAHALPAGLTEREAEVLRRVASGRTNRDVAAELSISQHTVARHLQNIYTKLGVASRSAATAYAYEHDFL